MPFPLEQAKAKNYFHQGFVENAVQVVGFGVGWQGLSSRQVKPWLDSSRVTPPTTYENVRATYSGVLHANAECHMQLIATEPERHFSAPLGRCPCSPRRKGSSIALKKAEAGICF
jgi:hypothetical protein